MHATEFYVAGVCPFWRVFPENICLVLPFHVNYLGANKIKDKDRSGRTHLMVWMS